MWPEIETNWPWNIRRLMIRLKNRLISLNSLLLLLLLSSMVSYRVVLRGMSVTAKIRRLLWLRIVVSIRILHVTYGVSPRLMIRISSIYMRKLVGTRRRLLRGVGNLLISLCVFIRGGSVIWLMMVLIMRGLLRGLLSIKLRFVSLASLR